MKKPNDAGAEGVHITSIVDTAVYSRWVPGAGKPLSCLPEYLFTPAVAGHVGSAAALLVCAGTLMP